MKFRDILNRHADEFIRAYHSKLTTDMRHAIYAIRQCQSGENGYSQWQCGHCHHQQQSPLSCGHRSCPQCQNQTTTQWLERQQTKLLPVDYFMVTFTLPAELRGVAACHPKRVYQAMFSVAADILKDFASRSPLIGDGIGFTSVLHTHNRRRDLHPHLHVVISGGGYDSDKQQWKNNKNHYLFNAFALAKVWRGRLLSKLSGMDKLKLPVHLPEKWVVDCRYVGHGKPALQYLSKYLYRGVLADKDIISEDGESVVFSYLDSQTNTQKIRTLSVMKFLWLILQHVLPKGFRRVRDYGFLRGNANKMLKQLQYLFSVVGWSLMPASTEITKAVCLCPCCHSPMSCFGVFRPR